MGFVLRERLGVRLAGLGYVQPTSGQPFGIVVGAESGVGEGRERLLDGEETENVLLLCMLGPAGRADKVPEADDCQVAPYRPASVVFSRMHRSQSPTNAHQFVSGLPP